MGAEQRDTGEYDLLWGDFHKHMAPDRIDEKLGDAKQHLDVYPVLCYPFEWYRKGKDGGMREETVGNQAKFQRWWDRIQSAAEDHHEPGEFVTFPAYEWNGNRTRWGDHNVIYYEEGEPLDDALELEDLYEALRERKALAIPHHTGYTVGQRGKDWDVLDTDLSPVAEIYSSHGSSEGVGTPVPMDGNPSMGPRTSGGTYVEALDRGHRVGAIASNDYSGLPGSWGRGVAGLWADDCTRAGVWDALENRRTYAATGDRIALWYEVEGRPMGSVFSAPEESVDATVNVVGQQPLDRIELIHNGRVAETYCHQGTWSRGPDERYKLLVEFGWGPKADYGDWEDRKLRWRGTAAIDGGSLESVQPRFNGWGQRFESVSDDACRFDVTTERDDDDYETKQGLVLTVDVDDDATLRVDIQDRAPVTVPVGELRDRAHLFAYLDDSVRRLEEEFDLSRDDLDNPDPIYHNAGKLKLHPAYPHRACATTVSFTDLRRTGEDYYYVRTSQVDGQYAWSSPVWVE